MKLILCFGILIVYFSMIVSQPIQFSRDPFVEITEVTVFDDPNNESKTMVIKLTGIIWDDSSPAAVLDVSGSTHVVYEGNNVFWINVVSISSSSIVLEGNDRQYMVRLGEEIVP